MRMASSACSALQIADQMGMCDCSAMECGSQHKNYGLQALRGIAAMLVYLQHLNWLTNTITPGRTVFNYVNLGVAGIFLFFALSGYLMTYKVNANPLRFIWQRLVRIMPGLWLALILAATIQWFLTGSFAIDPRVAALYPADEILPTYVPYWTLLYEMAFYVLVFASISALGKHAVWIVVPTLIASYVFADRTLLWPDAMAAGWRDLAFNQFSVFFLAGVIVARLPLIKTPKGIAFAAILGVAIFFSSQIAVMLGLPSLEAAHPLYRDQTVYWIQAIGVGLALAAFIVWRADGFIGRAFRVLGDASYGVYLIHIAMMFLVAAGLASIGAKNWNFHVVMSAIAVGALPATVAFGLFENRLQHWIKRLIAKGRPTEYASPLPSLSAGNN